MFNVVRILTVRPVKAELKTLFGNIFKFTMDKDSMTTKCFESQIYLLKSTKFEQVTQDSYKYDKRAAAHNQV